MTLTSHKSFSTYGTSASSCAECWVCKQTLAPFLKSYNSKLFVMSNEKIGLRILPIQRKKCHHPQSLGEQLPSPDLPKHELVGSSHMALVLGSWVACRLQARRILLQTYPVWKPAIKLTWLWLSRVIPCFNRLPMKVMFLGFCI